MTSYNEFLYGKNWATRTDIPFETDGKTTYPNPKYKPETDKYSEYYLGPSDPSKGKKMNDITNTPVANADMAEANANPFLDPNLTDEGLRQLLAAKPIDGEIVGYTTDATETDDEPTIH